MNTAELVRGVLEVREGYPMRLTENQRAWYHTVNRESADRADCTAGASIVFVTEETCFSLSYEVVSYCRSTNVIDVLENGIHTTSVRLPDMQSEETVVIRRATQGKALVELILPNTCGMRIRALSVSEWEVPAQRPNKLLLLGDSILQGIHSYHPTSSLANLLALELNAEMVNQSVGGAGFYPEVLEPLPFVPDWIFISMGINDVRAAKEKPAEPRIAAWFAQLRALYPSQKVCAVTPIWNTRFLGEAGYREKVEHIRGCIRQECKAWGIQVIEGEPLIPHVSSFFNEDGLHPNDLGFQCYTRGVLRQLKWE